MGDTTPVSPDPSLFGVTLRDVQSLLPRASLDDETPGARNPGASLGISSFQVNQWIELVAAEVNVRIAGWESILDETKLAYVRKGAKTAIVNGVAGYWDRARTQHRNAQGQTHYDDVFDRYKLLLADLAKIVKDWLDGGAATGGGGPSGSFPAPIFVDGMRF